MTRTDNLRAGSDPSCQATRTVTKNCNKDKNKGDKKERKEKKQNKGAWEFAERAYSN